MHTCNLAHALIVVIVYGIMGADLDKLKHGSEDEEPPQSEPYHSASENDSDAGRGDKDTGAEMHIQRKRSGSIYEKPKWQDQVAQATPDSTSAVVLFSDDGKHKLSRAYTVAACRFRQKSSSLRVIREESRNGSENSVVIIDFFACLTFFFFFLGGAGNVCQLCRFWDET